MRNSKKRGTGRPPKSNTIKEDDFYSSSRHGTPYEPSDSDDDYTQQEKMLLEKARSSSSKGKASKKLAVMDIPLDDDDDEDDDDVMGDDGEDDEDINMDSDIEGKEDDFNLPDQRAWGKTRKNYYNTDYVDQDYGGFDGEDAEAAELEEQEAREIQKRLAAELDDDDFSLDVFTKSKEEDQVISKTSEEIIKTDLSQLSSRQKLALLQKEAPELVGIISEFRDLMEELQNRLQPAMALVQGKQVLSPQLVQYIRTKYHLVNNYVMNMGFYLLLRARRLPVAAHPVVKRLLQYRQLLQQLKPLEDVGSNQLEELLSAAKSGALTVLKESGMDSKEKKNNQLQVLSFTKASRKDNHANGSDVEAEELSFDTKQKQDTKSAKNKTLMMKDSSKKNSSMPWENNYDFGSDGDAHSNDGKDEMVEDESSALNGSELNDEKRGITRQMAKNKGLGSHGKRELHNPRVKNRQKYRKAQIRRKGQVRTARTELERYGGELTGIKKTVTKSIKIK